MPTLDYRIASLIDALLQSELLGIGNLALEALAGADPIDDQDGRLSESGDTSPRSFPRDPRGRALDQLNVVSEVVRSVLVRELRLAKRSRALVSELAGVSSVSLVDIRTERREDLLSIERDALIKQFLATYEAATARLRLEIENG